MSTSLSQFHDRSIYNTALYARYGTPKSLDDYLWKAQAMDFEATRAQYEAYSAKKNAARPATGVIYWMLNNAWPSLHWNLFDYYFQKEGSFHGAKVGLRSEHVAFEYGSKHGDVWLINHTLDKAGARTVEIDLMGVDGEVLVSAKRIVVETKPNYSQHITSVPEVAELKGLAFLRLVLKRGDKNPEVLSRNVYWLGKNFDTNDWDNSTWYNTPVTQFADYTSLQSMAKADLITTLQTVVRSKENMPGIPGDGHITATFELENHSKTPAPLVRFELFDGTGRWIEVTRWEADEGEYYLTVWPGEKVRLTVNYSPGLGGEEKVLKVWGVNVRSNDIRYRDPPK